ncbi:uncharacterized protein LOC116341948 [Contarinia nasturtii]|uniref:uncharacterized protein LOC116341948 n=1 Tax=Contarinia nasturtii TaxID=265458 RepID=UPI0012D44EFD|nr:uncharacterized protein LOC116341948 [Contarinia nasturtii]
MFTLWRKLDLTKTIPPLANCSPNSLRNFNQIKVVTNNDSVAVTKEPADALETTFKSATHPMQVLSTLPSSPSEFRTMSGETVFRALQTIAVLQRTNKDTVKCDFITSHPRFEQLCRRLKRCSTMFTPDELVKSFRYLCSLDVPTNSEISLILLNLIRHEINHISVDMIIYLDYILSQTECRSELQRAIQTALPIVLDLQIPQQIDKHSTVKELVSILNYLASHKQMNQNYHKMTDICKLLVDKSEEITPDDAINIIYHLCAIDQFHLTNCIKLMATSIRRIMDQITDIDINNLQKLLNRMVAATANHFSPFQFHMHSLLKMLTERISQEDLGLPAALALQRTIKNISFQSVPLLKYIGDKLTSNVASCRTMNSFDVFTIVQAFSNNCYIPKEPDSNGNVWSDQILPEILANKHLAQIEANNATWMQFTLQLMILGHFNKELISRVLSESYLQAYLNRKDLSTLDLNKILILYQTVSMQKDIELTGVDTKTISSICKTYVDKIPPCKIQSDLIDHFGDEIVLTNVRTKHMHIINTLLKVNRETGQVGHFANEIRRDIDGFIALEDVPCNDNEMIFCIDSLKRHHLFSNMTARKFLIGIQNINEESKLGAFRLRSKQLEELGIEVCEINYRRYEALRMSHKAAYIVENIKNHAIKRNHNME